MTFVFGILTGILLTIGASLIVASDIDNDNNQF